MSRNAFARLDREYNEREDRLDEARAMLAKWHGQNGGAVVDTHALGRQNLNDTPSAGPLLDSDFQHLDDTPVPAPAVRCAPRRLSLRKAIRRAVLGRIYRFHLRCIRDEREGYLAAGMPLGPMYLANCEAMERDLRCRLALLDVE